MANNLTRDYIFSKYGHNFYPINDRKLKDILKATFEYQKFTSGKSVKTEIEVIETLASNVKSLRELYRNVAFVHEDKVCEDDLERREFIEIFRDQVCPVYEELFRKGKFDKKSSGYYGFKSKEDFKQKMRLLSECYYRILKGDSDFVLSQRLFELSPDLSTFNAMFTRSIFLEKGDYRLKPYKRALHNFEVVARKYTQLNRDGLIKVAGLYKENPEYLEYKESAEKVISNYMNSTDAYLLDSYLESQGLTNGEFLFAIELVRKVNKPLYKEFEIVFNSNKQKSIEIKKRDVEKIVNGICSGTINGREFTSLDFLVLCPFRGDNWARHLAIFLKEHFPSYQSYVSYYIGSNSICKNSAICSYTSGTFKPVSLDTILNRREVVDCREISVEEKKFIFDALTKMRLPINDITFEAALTQYLKDGLIHTDEIADENGYVSEVKNVELFVKDKKSQTYMRCLNGKN